MKGHSMASRKSCLGESLMPARRSCQSEPFGYLPRVLLKWINIPLREMFDFVTITSRVPCGGVQAVVVVRYFSPCGSSELRFFF